jgi:hypothetical protein
VPFLAGLFFAAFFAAFFAPLAPFFAPPAFFADFFAARVGEAFLAAFAGVFLAGAAFLAGAFFAAAFAGGALLTGSDFGGAATGVTSGAGLLLAAVLDDPAGRPGRPRRGAAPNKSYS